MNKKPFGTYLSFCLFSGVVAAAAPTNVVVSNIGAQTVGGISFYSSTQLGVSWSPASGETIDHYIVTATESVQNTSVSTKASSLVTSLTLNGLKAATQYSVKVKACADSSCSTSTSSDASTGKTSEEYWQLQGTGNGYTNVTKVVAEGSVLSWVLRLGPDAGSKAGTYQYYYKTNATGREGIGIATTNGTSSDATSPSIPFSSNSSLGLRSSCSSAPGFNTSSCPATGALEFNAIQVIPMKSGKTRAFFEASDVRNNKTTRIYSLDSQDGLVGQDFHPSQSQFYCGGIGSTDYASGGACEPTVLVDVGTVSSSTNPLLNARQFKIGYDWNADWRWDGASGTFMIITGEDTCNKYTSGLFYGTWNGSNWTVLKDSSNCAKPLVPFSHGPVLVPLGGLAYKLYYEDATNGQSGKPLRLLYGDGAISGDTAAVDFEDWESNTLARQVNFLWPDGSLVDAQDESGLGDHMILTPTGKLEKQIMFINLGGMDNSKTKSGSNGLGMAILLNSYIHTIGPINISPTSISVGGSATVTATANSGLEVSFGSTTPNVCTVNGNKVTGSNVGTCTIVANQTGNTIYAAATQLTQSIAITKAQNSTDCLFDWAEDTSPTLFKPSRPTTETFGDYTLRRYTSTKSYLGISNSNNRLYYYAPISSSNAMLDLGMVSTWKATAGCGQ